MKGFFFTILGILFVIALLPIFLVVKSFEWVFINLVKYDNERTARRIEKKISSMP